jgi:hypothetical protein
VAVIGSTVANVRLNDCKKVSRAKMPRAQRNPEIPLSSPEAVKNSGKQRGLIP